jgi:hypothetical protein
MFEGAYPSYDCVACTPQNGAGIQTCDLTSDNQKLNLNYLDNNVFLIQNSSKTKCLNNSAGTFSFVDCNQNENNQKYKWISFNSVAWTNSNNVTYYGIHPMIQSIGTSKCLRPTFDPTSTLLLQGDCIDSNKNAQRIFLLPRY